jgi:hypothetical protein
MIKITEKVWVGNSRGEETAAESGEIGAVLNVAKDMRPTHKWPTIEYAHVCLIDGPGNRLSAYCAAVLQLSAMVKDGKTVLVCCHSGSRALAVAMMHWNLTARKSWDMLKAVLDERYDEFSGVAEPHSAHKCAFAEMDWTTLAKLVQ